MDERYILSSQSFLDLISVDHSPVGNWAETVSNDNIYISSISIGQIRSHIECLDNKDPVKEALRDHLEYNLPPLVANNMIISIDHRIADRWGKLRQLELKVNESEGKDSPMDDPGYLIIATAIEHGLILVNCTQPCFSDLKTLGFLFHDPYTTDYENKNSRQS